MEHTFDTPAPIALDAQTDSGDITVLTSGEPHTRVSLTGPDHAVEETDVRMSSDNTKLTIRTPKGMGWRSWDVTIVVTVPTGSTAKATTGSGDVRAEDGLASFESQTGSGDITGTTVGGDVRAQTGSGNVTFDRVDGRCRAQTGSGDVTVHHAAGTVDASTGSGNVEIAVAEGDARAKVGSGDITYGLVRRGKITAETASGEVEIGIANGVVAKLDVSTVTGDIHSELEVDDAIPHNGDVVEVHARTVTGDVTLKRS